MGKKNLKQFVALFLVFALCLTAVVGCGKKEADETKTSGNTDQEKQEDTGKDADSSQSQTKKKYLIGFSSKQASNPFQSELIQGAQQAIDAETTEFVMLDANSDAAKQNNDFEDLIEMGCDAIIFVPYDSLGLGAAIKKAHDAGVILINIDNPVDDESAKLVDATVVSDNYQAGQLCAENLAKALDGKGDIGAYTVPTSLASTLRSQGFFETLESDYPDVKVVNSQTGVTGQTDAALPVMENILQSTPDIVGMFGYCDTAAEGCISAIKSAGKLDQIKVVSVDGSTDGKVHIRSGAMLGSAAQFPGKVAGQGVEAAYTLLEGGSVEKFVYVPTEWVNKDNVDSVKNFLNE
ncbi:substrate-binding domain-containing protein [Anaerolentibacter hominis]|uniref:substrate-binding domain-containing protein n=1 Tax=Anaerolentibacter hominis TaxID=3079009 RepID=UPI0031B8ADEC